MPTNLKANNEEWKSQISGLTHSVQNGNAACLVHYKERVFLFTIVSSDFSELRIKIDVQSLFQGLTVEALKLVPIVVRGLSDLPELVIAELDNMRLCITDVSHSYNQDHKEIIQPNKIEIAERENVYGFLNGAEEDAELIDLEYEETYANIDFYHCDNEYEAIIPGAPILDEQGNWVGISLMGKQGPGVAFGLSTTALLGFMDELIENASPGGGLDARLKDRGFDFENAKGIEGMTDHDFMEGSFPKMEDTMGEPYGATMKKMKEESGFEEIEEEDMDEDFIRYDVLYGTNRILGKAKADGSVTYGNKREQEMHLGVCEVSIPKTHKAGEIERPSWFRDLFFGESTKKDFTILHNEKLEKAQFLSVLNDKIGIAGEEDLLLFIHGFNVEYDAAMMNAAQLGFDLNYKGCVTAFSWPSMGTVSGYVADTATARASAIYLADFIEMVGNQTKNMNIIAHSMGNVVLTDALIILKNENRLPTAQINEIILAAPDLDRDIFVNQIIPKLKDLARFTLYASSKDKALILSRKIRAGYNRLGEGGDYITVVDGIESIDASDVDTSLLGHGYFTDTLSLINDIHQVLKGEMPQQRILDEFSHSTAGELLKYWKFKRT